MCGSPISGPILILFFPLGLGILAVSKVMDLVHSIDVSIRKNNEKIESGVSHISKDLKEKILFRKQLIAESKLEGKIKSDAESAEVARLHVQRAVVRLAAMKYEKALEDVKLALCLDQELEETYVWNFVKGVALYYCADYLESAHAFKRGIELKLALNSGSGDEKSVELEKKILDINMEMKHTHEKVKEHLHEFSENTKVYFNQFKSLMKGEKVDLSVQKEEKLSSVSLISLEELNYRAGCAYYFATCYQDAIVHFEKAIELAKDSPNTRHYIYNKGLCQYYNHSLEEALESFTQAMKLEENFETAQMISQTYGRKGELSKKVEYLKKAQELDPKRKPITTFHYRLLDEDCARLIFSYLPVYTRVNISSTNKYWRELLMRSVCDDHIFEISLRNLVNNVSAQNNKLLNRSIKEKIFLPAQERKQAFNFLEDVLKSSFFKYLVENGPKRVIIYSIYENYYRSFYPSEPIYPFLKNLEYLNIYHNSYLCIRDSLAELAPELKELVIRDDQDCNLDYSTPSSLVKLSNLKTLTMEYPFTDYFMTTLTEYGGFVFPESLEKFYYNPESCPEFIKIISKFPTIEFIPLTLIEPFFDTVE